MPVSEVTPPMPERPSTADDDAAASRSEKFIFTPAFWLLLAVQTAFGLGFSTFLLLPKLLTTELGASPRDIGLVTAVGNVAGVLMFPLVGTVSDRTGRKPFIVGGSVVLALTSLGFHAVDSLGPLLYALCIVRTASFACVFNSTTTLVTEQVAPKRMAQALGIFGVALLSTHAVAPAAAEIVSEHYGWGPVFTGSAALGVVSLLLSLALKEKSRPTTKPPSTVTVAHLLARPRTVRIVLTIATAGAGFGTLFILHQPFALSLGMQRVGGFFVAYASAAVFVRIFFGQMADRFGRQRVSALSLMVLALSIAAMAFLREGLLVPIGFVFGLAHGILYPAFNALAVEDIAESERGKMMSLYHGGFNAGQTLMVPIFGALIEVIGYQGVFMSMGLLAFAVAGWLLAAPIVSEAPAPGDSTC
jgi:MFS family permease